MGQVSAMSAGDEVRVFIVDDDASVRRSLRALLGEVGVPAADFPSAEALLEVVHEDTRGCVLLDVRMPGMSGLQLQEVLRERGLKLLVIVLTGHADVPMAVRAMKAGAVDFIEKPFNPQLLIERIQACLEAEAQTFARGQRRRDAEALLHSISTREREVLVLIARGLTNDEIAAELVVSLATVKTHVNRVLAKLGAASRAQAVVAAYESGLVRPRG